MDTPCNNEHNSTPMAGEHYPHTIKHTLNEPHTITSLEFVNKSGARGSLEKEQEVLFQVSSSSARSDFVMIRVNGANKAFSGQGRT